MVGSRRGFALSALLATAMTGGGNAALFLCTLTVSGVVPGGGDVFLAIYDSAESYRRGYMTVSMILDPGSSVLVERISLPPGEYMFSLFQDRNGNGKLDMNFLGIPTEPIGLSRFEGGGIPGGFERHKVRIDRDGQELAIKLIRYL